MTFCSPGALAALSALRALTISLVPVPSLAGLAALPALRELELAQAQPLSAAQAAALARCRSLAVLSVSSLAWPDIPELAALSCLSALSLTVYQPARGSLPGPLVGRQLLALRPLSRLRSLKLKGQCELPAELLCRLAGQFSGLTGLELCVNLPDGTQGLQHFTALRALKLQPYKWDGEALVAGCCWPRACREKGSS